MQNESVVATDTILKVENLRKLFPAERRLFGSVRYFVHAVDDISFEIIRGDSLALVGESGCGKTTTGKILVGLYEPTSGKVFVEQEDVTPLSVSYTHLTLPTTPYV